jgi:hypothetical protein
MQECPTLFQLFFSRIAFNLFHLFLREEGTILVDEGLKEGVHVDKKADKLLL